MLQIHFDEQDPDWVSKTDVLALRRNLSVPKRESDEKSPSQSVHPDDISPSTHPMRHTAHGSMELKLSLSTRLPDITARAAMASVRPAWSSSHNCIVLHSSHHHHHHDVKLVMMIVMKRNTHAPPTGSAHCMSMLTSTRPLPPRSISSFLKNVLSHHLLPNCSLGSWSTSWIIAAAVNRSSLPCLIS